ncbi:MAG: site-2 protease family protein [Bacteroidetes bacterium]|nr:site-2 protease family protein [Bacteroidota bacterium]MCY4223716.1 site-2 protease family protein [Bacteroidota bacterium]
MPASESPSRDRYLLHAGLFLVTLLSTALTGAILFIGRTLAWEAGDVFLTVAGFPLSSIFFADAFTFGGALIAFLTVHEFGHYIAGRLHQIKTSLPYFIPAPLIGIGTLGAVITIRQPISNLTKLFDLGASGPIAGFILVVVMLIAAMISLPSPEYLFGVDGHYSIKEYIRLTGQFPDTPISDAPPGSRLTLGSTPLYWVLSMIVPDVPPLYEMYHYPLLFAVWLGLFFTALNLMPVGQLDGGHIIYALFGPKWHARISRSFIFAMLTSMASGAALTLPQILIPVMGGEFLGTIGVWITIASLLTICTIKAFKDLWWKMMLTILVLASFISLLPDAFGWFAYFGWLPWCFLLIFLVKVDHPPVPLSKPIGRRRRVIGYLTLCIFLLCFSIKPFYSV